MISGRAMKYKCLMGLLLVAMLGLQGCAGIVEIRMPQEFKNGKIKEDPPVTILPSAPSKAYLC
jgi:hypothetical protein